MNRNPSTCAPTRVIRAAQTSMVAVFVASCGGGTPASSDVGSGPDCGPLTYDSGDECQPPQIGAGADGGRQGEGEGAADATTEEGIGLDGGGGAADASMDADTRRDGGNASADATGLDGGGGAADASMDAGARGDGGDASAHATTDDAGGGTPDASDGSSDTSSMDVALSDTCSNGIVSIASDVLNPGDVYLDGTLQEGVCGADALTHWSDPNSACTGFDCYFNGGTAVIRPTDGRMIYMNTFEYALREFHANSCPMPAMSAYPSTPLANDTIIPTPMCPTLDGAANVDVAGFVVSPEGDVYYHCFGSGGAVWYDLAGNAVYDESNGYGLKKIARGHTALVGLSAIYKLANLTTGVLTDIAAPPWNQSAILAIRAMDTAGFWVAVSSTITSNDPELWELHPDGTSTQVGSYPPLPVGQTRRSEAALDGCGALLQISSGPAVFEDTIVRRQVQGSSQVVYDEATNPLVKIDISYLITGP